MTDKSDNQGSTKDRLLESACAVFAEKGYRDATVADICNHAEVNIASVNYYFGDKETLYAEAWRLSFQRAVEAYPSDAGLGPDASAEDRLAAHVRAVLLRIFDPGKFGYSSRILFAEMGSPSGALLQAIAQAITPQRERLHGIVREIIGDSAPEDAVKLCTLSVINQCLAFGSRPGIIKNILGKRPDVNSLAEHITRFSIAGFHAIGDNTCCTARS